MRRLQLLVPALLAALALAACGGGNNDNRSSNNENNSTNNQSNTTTNNQSTAQNNDLCADETCASPAAHCAGMIAVTYNGDGTCDASDGSCSYDLVEERTDCSANDQICRDGACGDDEAP